MTYYTELQLEKHSSTQEIGAISFYRIAHEHRLPWQRPKSAVNMRPLLLA